MQVARDRWRNEEVDYCDDITVLVLWLAAGRKLIDQVIVEERHTMMSVNGCVVSGTGRQPWLAPQL